MRKAFKNTLLALNYGITVTICLLLVIAQQIAIIEKAVVGFGAIGIGMFLRKIINWAFSPNKSASSQD